MIEEGKEKLSSNSQANTTRRRHTEQSTTLIKPVHLDGLINLMGSLWQPLNARLQYKYKYEELSLVLA